MTTINMRKLEQNHQEDDEFNPFTEYVHDNQEPTRPVAQSKNAPLRPQQELLDNIDKMFDGANFVFDIANKFLQRLGGR
jgi:hypothetical protein